MGNETKFTPGEWVTEKGRDAFEIKVSAPSWIELATVYGRDPDNDMPDGRWNDEGHANARLIAAAPDLFEALMAYQAANRVHNDAEDALYSKAEAAIEKALGSVRRAEGGRP